jgi:hypothetical protein
MAGIGISSVEPLAFATTALLALRILKEAVVIYFKGTTGIHRERLRKSVVSFSVR